MVWFNEETDEWLQMRQTVMKVAPVSMTTDDNKRDSDKEALFEELGQQQKQQVTDATATEMPSPG